MANISMLDTRNSDQQAIDSSLSSFVKKYLPQFVPGEAYTGSLSAPMTGFENQGMGFLQSYLDKSKSAGANPMLGLAEGELTKTFTGQYDPSTSPFYKATRDAAMTERQDALNKMNQGLGARKKFFSSEALTEGRELDTRTTNFMQQTLGKMAEQERVNRLNAVPMAINMDAARTKADIAPIAAATTFGAIPREVDQENLERQYQEFKRQREEKALPLKSATSTYSNLGQTPVITPEKPKFDWGSFLGQVGSIAAQAGLAYATGGGSLALSGASGLASNSGQSLASMSGSNFLSGFGGIA